MELSNAPPSGFGGVKSRHRCLAVIRELERTPDYALNIELLDDWLVYCGLTASRDEIVTLLEGLDKAGAVSVEERGSLRVVTLTARGADLARGVAADDAVLRPGPSCAY